MKYEPSICSDCNNARTARADRAYDRPSDWFAKSQQNGGQDLLHLNEIFGAEHLKELRYLKCYFAKSLGCRVVTSDVMLPENFPNPVTRDYLDRLQISICRTQLFRSLPNYEASLGEATLGKGDLIAKYSRSFLEQTGHRKISQAIWWETIGNFQINHWLNIDPDPRLGKILDGVPFLQHCCK